MKVWQLVDEESFLANDSTRSINKEILSKYAGLRGTVYFLKTETLPDHDGDFEILDRKGCVTDEYLLKDEVPYFHLVEETDAPITIQSAEHFLEHMQNMGVIFEYDKEQLAVALETYEGAK